jgi:hypothetical protein
VGGWVAGCILRPRAAPASRPLACFESAALSTVQEDVAFRKKQAEEKKAMQAAAKEMGGKKKKK